MQSNEKKNIIFDKANAEENIDRIWRGIMSEYMREKGKELIDEMDEIKDNTKYQPSEEAIKKFNEILQKFFPEGN